LVGGICQPVRFFRRRLPCVVATTRPISGELTLALEARQAALEGFESDARLIQDDFSALSGELRSIKSSMANFAKHPLDEAFSKLIVPLSAVLLRTLEKKLTPDPGA